MIHIRNGKRFNIYAGGVIDGVRYANFTSEEVQRKLGITAIVGPTPPAGYDSQTWTVNEIDDEPYVIYTQRSQAERDAIRWEQLRQTRDALTDNGGVLVADKWFHTDPKSKQQQMALMMLGANLPAGLMWKTMDGSFIEMTQALVQQLFAAQVQREQVIFTIAETKRLDDTPINEGWPDRYVDPEALP